MIPRVRRCLAAPILLVVLLALPLEGARAQSRVQGTVVAASTGEPLADVQVYVPRLRRGVITDSGGSYTLTGLASGAYTVEFSRLGYEKRVRTLDVADGATLSLDVVLAPQTLEAGEVVIVADEARPATGAPLPTLSVDEAGRVERGRMSLWEDLDRQPGMARSTNGPGIERPFIRGLSGGRILLLVQHLPYAYQTWDPEAGLATNGTGTEQVDVIQGPSTLRYGPGAMGVIDLVPERPAPAGHAVGSFTGGLYSNTEGLNSTLALKQSGSRWFWGARAGYDTHADYRAGGDFEREDDGENEREEEEEGKVPNSRYDHVQGQVFAGLSRAWGSTRLTYQFLQHRNGIVEAEEEAEREEEGEREIEPPYHAIRDHLLTSDTQIRLGRGWLHGVLGVQANRQQEFEPEGEFEAESEARREEEGEAALDLELTTFHARFDYDVPLTAAWSLTSGFQGFVQQNESEGEESFIPNADAGQAGAFALLTWRRGRVVVESGLRYDTQRLETSPPGEEGEERENEEDGEAVEIERTFGLVSGSVGGTYRAGEGQYLKLNVGVGGRTPNVAELTASGRLREVHRFLIGDAELDAEQNVEGDATLGWRFPWVTVSLGGFYNRIHDYIYLFATGTTEDGFPMYRYRQGDADFRGGHAGLTLHPSALGGLRLFSRFDVVLADLSDDPGYDLPMIPAPHVLNGLELAGAGIGPFRQVKLRVEVDTYFEQDRVPPWEAPSEGYSLVNASLNAQLPWNAHTVLLGLHGLNLFDTGYISHLSLLKADGIPDMGRSITVSARIPFGW